MGKKEINMARELKFNLDEFIRLYRQGYLDKDIAKILGISKTAVKYWRKRLGLGESNYLKRKARKVDLGKLIELLKQEYGYRYIADQLNVTVSTVALWASKLNLNHRYRSFRSLWEKRRDMLRQLLVERVMVTYKEAERELNLTGEQLRGLLRRYPDIFTSYKFTYYSRKYSSKMIDGLLYRLSGKYIALRNDKRVIDYIASRIFKPITVGQARSLRWNLKNVLGDEVAEKVLEKIYSK